MFKILHQKHPDCIHSLENSCGKKIPEEDKETSGAVWYSDRPGPRTPRSSEEHIESDIKRLGP